MTPTDRFEVLESQSEPLPRIVIRSRASGSKITLDAAVLLAQYAISDDDTLLVLDEDCPYEENLHLVLVRGSRVIDHIELGMIYTGGIFKEISAADDTLRFRFESDAVWSLTVDSRGKRGIGGLPTGSRRRGHFFSRRYLELEHGGVA
ncbi:MAG: hypothetical protein AAGK01_02030 [Pseudomonadota bacterium]